MKVALIEIGGSHDECLYTQILFLKSVPDLHLTLICDEGLKANVSFFNNVDHTVFFSIKNGLKKWSSLYHIWKYCRSVTFDKIIFNTAQGTLVSSLLTFPFGRKTRLYGIIHDVKKLKDSVSQRKITRKLAHYFILNDYLKESIPSEVSHSVFYPIFFADYPHIPIEKKDNDIWICIPGQVELKRRDYKSLFDSIQKHGIHHSIKFILLGRYGHSHGDGEYILQQINNLQIHDHFLTYRDFIPVEMFHAMVSKSDYILPLIHPNDVSGNLYKNQITGAFNLAIAYKKPILMEKQLTHHLDETISYEVKNMMETINRLDKYDPNNLYRDQKWTFDFQKEKYLRPLGLLMT